MGQRLYVGNLPFSADEEQIRALFAQNGRTVNAGLWTYRRSFLQHRRLEMKA